MNRDNPNVTAKGERHREGERATKREGERARERERKREQRELMPERGRRGQKGDEKRG